jgi:threonylcarbamoyladenosine tRNA methylthiotransferase MtaB
MPNQVSNAVKKERSNKLIEATDITRRNFLLSQVGQVCEVLFETADKLGAHGYTKNYTPVYVKSGKDLQGKILKVVIKEAFDDYCVGELLKEE